ncbi:bifunctional enoyl-CoA hydratase/phosphate acetyltransferase [Silvibacterium sp.]|uniref:bifunctional enoyl-CoA hydratase/phosphate acetyltransferase n=1 Tax=Silvibacterium sp. TaxID=1964179 RepID=UPI0039E3D6CC
MNLGFVESRTFDEIALGDTARAEHVFTGDDALAFASISGFQAVLDQGELARRAGGEALTGPNMWCASLVSGLFSMQLPGPGVTLTGICLAFHNRIHVGDRVFVSVEVTGRDEATRQIDFACEAHDERGAQIFTGTAKVLAPVEKQRWSTLPVPHVIVNNSYRRYQELIARATARPAVRTAVAWPCDAVSLSAALEAAKDDLIVPVLVGAETEIRRVAHELSTAMEESLSRTEIIEAADSRAAAAKAVELARAGAVGMLMKGSLHTDELMGAVIAKESGLRAGRRISHIFALDVPMYPKTLFVTDAAINIQPDLETKVSILQNAIDAMLRLGVREPKVAILSAVESVNPAIPSTLEAAALCKMAERGQIRGAIVDGPLAFDNAISSDAARIKHIASPVAGDVDLLMVPNLEAGNILFKQLQYLAGALAAGVVVGAKVPIVLTSRADGELARMASCALGVLLA